MTDQKPSVGRMVHYETCDLVVFNPTGLFFNRAEHQDPLGTEDRAPGTWHWPERV